MPPARAPRSPSNNIDTSTLLLYIASTGQCFISTYVSTLDSRPAPHIAQYYALYSDEIHPLSDFNTVPKDVVAVPLPNGDVALHLSNGEELTFNVISAVAGYCFEPPPSFPKSVFPSLLYYRAHFRQVPGFPFTANGSNLLPSMNLCLPLHLGRVMFSTILWPCIWRTFFLTTSFSLSVLSACTPRQRC